jgi:hypothetical protein
VVVAEHANKQREREPESARQRAPAPESGGPSASPEVALQSQLGNRTTSAGITAGVIRRSPGVGLYYDGKQRRQGASPSGSPRNPGISDAAAEGVGAMFARAEAGAAPAPSDLAAHYDAKASVQAASPARSARSPGIGDDAAEGVGAMFARASTAARDDEQAADPAWQAKLGELQHQPGSPRFLKDGERKRGRGAFTPAFVGKLAGAQDARSPGYDQRQEAAAKAKAEEQKRADEAAAAKAQGKKDGRRAKRDQAREKKRAAQEAAEEKARAEAEEKARAEAEAKAAAEAEAKAAAEAEAKAKAEAEEKVRAAAEAKAKADADAAAAVKAKADAAAAAKAKAEAAPKPTVSWKTAKEGDLAASAEAYLAEVDIRLKAANGDDAVHAKAQRSKVNDPLAKVKAKRALGRYVPELRTALTNLESAMKEVGVDKLAGPRDAVVARAKAVEDALAELEKLGSAAGSTAARLVGGVKQEASAAVAAARADKLTSAAAIGDADALLGQVERSIELARSDVPVVDLVSGDLGSRRSQLATLRGALSASQMADLVPLVTDRTGEAWCEHLVQTAKAAMAAPKIKVSGLAELLPLCQPPQLARAVKLAGAMDLSLADTKVQVGRLAQYGAELPPSLVDRWFGKMPLARFVDLTSAFTPTGLRAFAEKLDEKRVEVLMGTHAVPASALAHYADRIDLLQSFGGIPKSTWAHVQNQIGYNEVKKQISGGHDRALFDGLFAKLPPDTWRLKSKWSAGDIEKFEYKIYNSPADKKSKATPKYQGSKTVVTDLADSKWLDQANEAAWDALRRSKVDLGAERWDGTDSTGVAWTGHFKKGTLAMATVYPA